MAHAALSGFTEVVSLMSRIKDSGAQYPRVRLAFAEKPLVLTMAGARAKLPGSINLTDGGRYPDNTFYGRIATDGTFEPGGAARSLDPAFKAALWSILTRLKSGEAEEVFAEYGKQFGTCCLCGRELTNDDSVELGIGPICRERAFG